MNNGWQNPAFCMEYLKNVSISTEDVHYGYLATGERELGLLGERRALVGKRVLEIGCGAAQNCIALSKWGATCTGVDISEEMLRRAQALTCQEGVQVDLKLGDALDLMKIIGNGLRGKFDIFLSSYAIGFICKNLKDFVFLVFQIKQLASPGARLVFCLRHPCQMEGVVVDENSEWIEACFAVSDVTSVLESQGFRVISTVEQTTLNPSKLTDAEKKRFPYATLVTDVRFDSISHKPHTIIYSAQLV